MSERIPQRNEIPAEHKWSIEDLYATDAAWEQDLSKAKESPAKIASYKGLLSTDSAKLLEYLKIIEQFERDWQSDRIAAVKKLAAWYLSMQNKPISANPSQPTQVLTADTPATE